MGRVCRICGLSRSGAQRQRAISARLFADSAAVQKIGTAGGRPAAPRRRRLTPKGNSAWFAFLNFNKSSIALDLDNPQMRQRAHHASSWSNDRHKVTAGFSFLVGDHETSPAC